MPARRKPTRARRGRNGKRRTTLGSRRILFWLAAAAVVGGLLYGFGRDGMPLFLEQQHDRIATAPPSAVVSRPPVVRPTSPPDPAPPPPRAVEALAPGRPMPSAEPQPAPATPEPVMPAPSPAETQAQPPWLRHAAVGAPASGRPMIAVVIDDLGVDRRRSGLVTGLPGPLTLAWLPYARDLPAQTASARSAGHELLVHLPMEPSGSADPGPGAMLTHLPVEELRRRLDAGLAAFDGYIGVNNHMGSRFTEDRAAMSVVLDEIGRRGLMFLDSRTSGRSIGYELAREMRMPAAARDVFIDHDPAPAAVLASLKRLEDVAVRRGHAVGIGHPHDVTIQALKEWLPGLEGRGFALVPVSAIVRSREAGTTEANVGPM